MFVVLVLFVVFVVLFVVFAVVFVVFVLFSVVDVSVLVSNEEMPSIGMFLHINVALNDDVDSPAQRRDVQGVGTRRNGGVHDLVSGQIVN